ncbi:MAG: alanine racemase [Proteobacteria bacterium]|nr:alanine racemase [Pseudomonadota bacterium]
MATGTLTIDLDALLSNWKALDALSSGAVETAAVVKANAYGIGAGKVAEKLAVNGVRSFFVANVNEGAVVRQAVGAKPEIYIFNGHADGKTAQIRANRLTPLLNSVEQFQRHSTALAGHPFGVQLDSGMNRLGMEPADFLAVRDRVLDALPALIISHMACADEPDHPQNRAQLATFHAMTDGLPVRRSLAATGGLLLGPEYHFDLVRPGIGLYGGLPFTKSQPVVHLSLPVVQVRQIGIGETVGYGAAFRAARPTKIATVAAGYADGLIRALSGKATLWAGDTPCPLIGSVSMDLLTVDVTDLAKVPDQLDILCEHQSADQLAAVAGTIGYEILTSLGARYNRVYKGGHITKV